ncbi:MAG: ArsR/SmtB family transcription factor [Lewinella sp.]|uniref:ArsR/SmtB family transcription factor n=1 Tax=Lewinella sp. TaxID=2004506 RepID=UPI003D6BF96A
MKVLTEQKFSANSQEEMAKFAKALAHPTRLEILRLFSTQSCCFTGDLVEVLPIAQSTVSQHLKELKNAGLIQGEIDAPKIKYCINQENWRKAKLLFAAFFE